MCLPQLRAAAGCGLDRLRERALDFDLVLFTKGPEIQLAIVGCEEREEFLVILLRQSEML